MEESSSARQKVAAWQQSYAPSRYPGAILNYSYANCDAQATFPPLDRASFYEYWLSQLLAQMRATRGESYLLDAGEIGALHEKAPIPERLVRNRTFIDGLSFNDLRKMYPELEAQNLQIPDIVDRAETLAKVPSESFDFFVATHVIEHTYDALETLKNWLRVVRPGGFLFMAIPSMCHTFDRLRMLTTWEHFAAEYQNKDAAMANKYEHFREFALSDWSSRSPGAPDAGRVESVAKKFFDRDYFIHYHTWVPNTALQFVQNARSCLGMPLRVIHFNWDAGQIWMILQRAE